MKTLRTAITVAALLLSGAAMAQTTDVSQKEAEARFAEGQALYAAGKIDDARVKFTEAHAVLRTSTTLWNLAVAETYSKHPLEALRHFRELSRMRDVDASLVAKAHEKYIPDLEKQTARIKVDGDALRIKIDGESVPDAERTRDVAAGPHRVEITTNHGTTTQDATCVLGDTLILRVPTTTDTPPPPGEPAPSHGPSTAKLVTTIGLAVVGVGGIVGGAVFAADSSSKKDAASSLGPACAIPSSPACSDLQSKVDSGNSSATASTVLYVVGGVALAGAAVLWFVWPNQNSSKQTGVWLTPSVGRGGPALELGGCF